MRFVEEMNEYTSVISVLSSFQKYESRRTAEEAVVLHPYMTKIHTRIIKETDNTPVSRRN